MFVEDRHVVDDARAIGRQRQPVDLTLTTAAQGPEDLTDGGDHLVEHREISTVGEDPRASQGPEIVVTVECDGFGNVLLDQTYPQCRNVLGLEVLLHRVGWVSLNFRHSSSKYPMASDLNWKSSTLSDVSLEQAEAPPAAQRAESARAPRRKDRRVVGWVAPPPAPGETAGSRPMATPSSLDVPRCTDRRDLLSVCKLILSRVVLSASPCRSKRLP